ncbi:MAG TPA: hypothetical protein VF777_11805 [Phycisphaerales bacterium]
MRGVPRHCRRRAVGSGTLECGAQESGGGAALGFEELGVAVGVGVGDAGQGVDGSGAGHGKEIGLAKGFGGRDVFDHAACLRRVDDVEHLADRELRFLRDDADGERVVEEAGEDEVEVRAGVRGKGWEVRGEGRSDGVGFRSL